MSDENESYRKLRLARDLRAGKEGEGGYRKKSDGQWYHVEVTFYPKVKLWISDPTRREITLAELALDFEALRI